jgi:GTP cyclohydrolase II
MINSSDVTISHIANLPTTHGDLKMQSFEYQGREHLAIFTPNMSATTPTVPIVRLHSECLTGDALGSLKCDCGAQLNSALDMISKNGNGMLIYLRQEGRGIGLVNKVNAYALQDQGHDTIEANIALGFKADERTYDIAEFILNHYNIKQIRLITNNPHKIASLKTTEVLERIETIMPTNQHNQNYLLVKKEKSGHYL